MSGPRILIVDDEAEICRLLQDILVDEGYDTVIATTAAEARRAYLAEQPALVLLDIWMRDVDGITLLREWLQADGLHCPIVMMSGHGTVEAAVEATRLGAHDFIEKPLSMAKLLHVAEEALAAARHKRHAPRLLGTANAPVGRSRVLQQLREQVQRIAGKDTAVLLLGEAGSGRETLARYLRLHSSRANQPFVQLTPASISDDNAAGELCGVGSGDDQPGLLEQARGGTLFIKGIEDTSPALQRLLLAAIETKSFTRVGAHTPIALDVRFVSSAEPGFPGTVASGFRADLLNQLNAITLHVPPLREHAEDVPELLRYYVERLADEEHLPLRRFGLSAQNRLRNYPWPGNVQELRNLVRRLLILGGGEEIRLDELERELNAKTSATEPLVKHDLLALPLREAREHFERAYLQQQLMLCNGKVGQLAKRVGMERTHLYRKLRALGVDFRQLAED